MTDEEEIIMPECETVELLPSPQVVAEIRLLERKRAVEWLREQAKRWWLDGEGDVYERAADAFEAEEHLKGDAK